MSERILVGKSAQEYFREMVGDVLAQRRLRIQEETEFYLVNVLGSFLGKERLFVEDEGGRVHGEPLALILLRALQGNRRARVAGLRRLGDTALFVSGFFGDSVARSAVGLHYYFAMGEGAYGALRDTEKGLEALFGELADRFQQFADLFAEIAELSEVRSNRGLIRLYERFLLTRSERVARMLRDRGVALFGGPAARTGLKH